MEQFGNYKLVDGDKTWIKVIDFPVPEGSPVGGESMWVIVVEGTDNDGIGTLDNEPVFCTEVKHGDRIRYGGGTDDKKPKYMGKES